jgi:hypothetical protein
VSEGGSIGHHSLHAAATAAVHFISVYSGQSQQGTQPKKLAEGECSVSEGGNVGQPSLQAPATAAVVTLIISSREDSLEWLQENAALVKVAALGTPPCMQQQRQQCILWSQPAGSMALKAG